jgi:hypothetical protein
VKASPGTLEVAVAFGVGEAVLLVMSHALNTAGRTTRRQAVARFTTDLTLVSCEGSESVLWTPRQ